MPLNLQPRPGRQWAAVSGKNKEPGRAPRPRMRATYTRTAGVRHLLAALERGEDKLFGHIRLRKTRARFLEFTPTGSSWINQVERWFGYLTDQMIRRGVHRSVRALEADIRAWIEHWNASPRPFAWTKTADEILDSLARYISRISGAGY